MDEITLISYPGSQNSSLLSLTGERSKYMLPFGGRFRIVDFTIGNSFASGALKTIIYSNCEDDLESYVEKYGPFANMNFPPIQVVSRDFSDINTCYNLVMDSNTDYYVIYNGDNPAVINFSRLIKSFKKKKRAVMLYKMKFAQNATLAYTILVINQKTLLKVINKAIDEKRESPNIFEMIVNILLNKGIDTGTFSTHYWPIRNIPDYYHVNMSILRDPDVFAFLYKSNYMKTQIQTDGLARLGQMAKISNSFISDGCTINGTITNSIIYPGVTIGEKTVITDSIILPYARIGDYAKINRTVLDESRIESVDTNNGEERDEIVEKGPPELNIGDRCRIGSEYEQLKNNDFPRSIFNSITLIGKNCIIPEESIIGGACYIASGLGREYFSKSKHLYDGLSLVK